LGLSQNRAIRDPKMIASGYVKIAIENGYRNSSFTELKNVDIFSSFYVNVYQRAMETMMIMFKTSPRKMVDP
jgi:hypothetical protein